MPSHYEDDDPRRWTQAQSKRARKYFTPLLPLPCAKCGELVYADEPWAVDHVIPRALLQTTAEVDDVGNMGVAHKKCNDRAGAKLGNARRRVTQRNRGNVTQRNRGNPPGQKGVVTEGNQTTSNEDPLRLLRSNGDPARRATTTPLKRPQTTSNGPKRVIHPSWWPITLRNPPKNACLPRVETPHHPLTTGSYGGLVVAHAASYGVTLRWWQEYVMWRLLEHDADGNLLWPEVAVSVARQVGKGYGALRPLCEWRSEQGTALFGEPQTILHLSHQVNTVMEIATPGIARARDLGHRVRLTNGEQMIGRPDGSRWLMRSTTGAYGFSVNMAVIDEVWAVPPRVVDSMVMPTMIERVQPQLVMFSTANSRPTPLYTRFRDSALGGGDDRLVLEWSAPPDADPSDTSVWRMASPHWSDQRERMMVRALETSNIYDFKANWLNIWPDPMADGPERPLIGWTDLQLAPPDPGRGGIVAIDEYRDASAFASVTLLDGNVYFRESTQLTDLVPRANAADQVIVGLTVVEPALRAGLRHQPLRYGMKETRLATPLLGQEARRGALKHDHEQEMAVQAAGAVVADTESGKSLSAKRSDNEVTGPKLLAWCLYARRQNAPVRPMIY